MPIFFEYGGGGASRWRLGDIAHRAEPPKRRPTHKFAALRALRTRRRRIRLSPHSQTRSV